MPNVKVLVVDDEQNILELVSAYLEREGYQVYTAADGTSGLKALRAFRPDVVILDIMLPGVDGLEVLSRLRRESNAYVIMLTAKAEDTDKVVGLSVGADDYMTKPFSPHELVARVKAALRRMRSMEAGLEREVLSFKHLRIDKSSRRVWMEEEPVDLTATEFDLLLALAERRGMVMSREQLLERVWGYDYYGETRVVDVHIGHIRQKIGGPELIQTVRGVGYRFVDEVT